MNPYIFVFIVTAVARLSSGIIFLPHIKEVRKVKKLPHKYDMFSHPFSFIHSESTRILHMPERVYGKFKSLRFFGL